MMQAEMEEAVQRTVRRAWDRIPAKFVEGAIKSLPDTMALINEHPDTLHMLKPAKLNKRLNLKMKK